jgi:CMP/dCMP kinase
MIITISGKPGSGKSTVAKKLAVDLGYKRYYIGGMRREAAKARGIALDEFNKIGESSNITDKEFDDIIQRIGQQEDNCIVEGRLAFHFIPHSLKIFLDASDEEGARRIWGDLQKSRDERNEGKNLNSYDEVVQSIRGRVQSDTLRYNKHYGIQDLFEKSHYDLYLDTTRLSPEEEYQAVYQFVQQRLSH